jgi:hypothetical protein
MKFSYVVVLLFFVGMLSCKKDKAIDCNNNQLVGNWKAFQWQNDIGDGSTPYSDIPSNNNYYMHFMSNNNFNGDYIFGVGNYNKFQVIDNKRVNLYKENTTDSLKLYYSFENEKLILSFGCIEACNLKLIRK